MTRHSGTIFVILTGNMSANSSTAGDEMYLASYLKPNAITCFVLNILLTVVGFFGNSMSIYIFSRSPRLSSRSSTIQLICLSAADLMLLLLFIPLVIAPQILFIKDYEVPKALPDVIHYSFVYLYPCSVTFQTISVMLLMLITAERFVAVCYPIKVSRLFAAVCYPTKLTSRLMM